MLWDWDHSLLFSHNSQQKTNKWIIRHWNIPSIIFVSLYKNNTIVKYTSQTWLPLVCFLLTFPGVFVTTSNKQPCEIRLYINNINNNGRYFFLSPFHSVLMQMHAWNIVFEGKFFVSSDVLCNYSSSFILTECITQK